MQSGSVLELEETLTQCSIAIREARYVAMTVTQRFDPLWIGADDPRKGSEFVADMGIAMGLVCSRLKSAIEYIKVLQKLIENLETTR